jgi:hypothetical protein
MPCQEPPVGGCTERTTGAMLIADENGAGRVVVRVAWGNQKRTGRTGDAVRAHAAEDACVAPASRQTPRHGRPAAFAFVVLCLVACLPVHGVAAVSSSPGAAGGQSERQTCPEPQTPAQICGAEAVADFAALYNIRVPETYLEVTAGKFNGAAMSFAQLCEELRTLGIPTKGLAATYSDLVQLNRPVIARVNPGGEPHFIVLETATSDWGRVVERDQASLIGRATLEKDYTGYALCYWGEGDTLEAPRPNRASVEPRLSKVPADPGKMGALLVRVANTSDSPLAVTGIRATKGWEVGGIATPTTLAPGSELAVKVQPAPSVVAGAKAAWGPGELVIATDDPTRPHYRASILLESSPLPPLGVSGDQLDFGEGDRSDVLLRKRYMVVDYEGTPGSLYVEPGEPWIRCSLLHEEAYARNPWEKRVHAQVEVQLKEEAPAGPQTGKVLLSVVHEGSDGEDAQAQVLLTSAIWPEVRAEPRELFLGIIGQGETARAEVRIIGRPDWTYVVQPQPAFPRGLAAKIRPSRSGKGRVLQVIANGRLLPAGATEGEVVLSVSGQSRKSMSQRVELRVPYSVYVKKAPSAILHDHPRAGRRGGGGLTGRCRTASTALPFGRHLTGEEVTGGQTELAVHRRWHDGMTLADAGKGLRAGL